MEENEMKVFSFEKICRLCLNEKQILIEIFDSYADNNNLTIDQKIKACATVNMAKGDGLPTRICIKCLSRLNAAFDFKVQCENADKTLHSIHNLFFNNNITEEESLDKIFEVNIYESNKKISDDQVTQDFNQIIIIKKQEGKISRNEEQNLMEADVEKVNRECEENVVCYSQEEVIPEISSAEEDQEEEAPFFVSTNTEKVSQTVAPSPENRKGIGVTKVKSSQKKKENKDFVKSPCPFCNKMLARVDEHIRLLHRNRVYVCTKRDCGAEFLTLKNLQSHQLRCYDVEKAYKCPKCSKDFHRKSNYKAHVRRHADKKDFQCQLCDRAFVDSTGLRRHFLKHHEPEQEIFISGCCGKKFKSKEGLKKHIRNEICGFQILNNEDINDLVTKETSKKFRVTKS